MKIIFSRAVSALFLFLATISLSAQELPKREFRGGWLHIVGNYSMTKMNQDEVRAWITDALDDMQAAGCNAVIFQVRPQADAFYVSELEPWTRFMTGTQGKAPSPLWDPLQFTIEQAHARGMELHAWLNPYRVTSTDKEVLCSDHLYHKRPDLFLRYGKQIYFDPGEPEAREHTVNVIRDIVTRYDVDAIHFDDYFYPYPIAGQDFPDGKSFAKYAAKQGFSDKGDWRRNNVTELIKEINVAIKEIKPWVRFGISPFGIHRNKRQDPAGSDTNGLSTYDDLYADIPLWSREGYIDYVVPQLYWEIGHSRADFKTLIHWWNDADLGAQLYIGEQIAGLSKPDLDNPETTQLAAKMKMERELENVLGNVWWPAWSIGKNVGGIADSLSTKYQKYPALIPVYYKLDNFAPEEVISFDGRRNGDGSVTLEWLTDETSDPLQEAAFFVVYRFPKGIEADFDDSQYIYCLTRSSHITIPDEENSCSYAVTVTDHCWNESEPSRILDL